jgi:lactate dehydrogenase-like 2-hydroxyacid dehydrogenase
LPPESDRARNGVGFDTVDLAAATQRGVVVTNTPLAVRRPSRSPR